MSSASGTDQDPTRKERREQARGQRKALEEAERAQTARRKRLIQLASVIGAVVVVIVVIVVATGGTSKKSVPHAAEAAKSATAVSALLSGISQSGNTLGNPKAPATMQYFGDLECPICQQFTLGALPPLIEKYVRTGKLKIQYRSLETATREPSVFTVQQVAALAAGKQNRLWQYVELFYHEQGQEDSGYVTESYLQKLASEVQGMNLANWTAARNDTNLANEVTSDGQAATQAGFSGTPSFLIGKTGGTLQPFQYASLTDPSSFSAAIDKLLA